MVFILVLALLLALPVNTLAARPQVETQNYLNLGDSIAAGMSAYPGQSYFDGYAEYLEEFGWEIVPEWTGADWDWFIDWYKNDGKFESGNVAMPGMTSFCLLRLLSTDIAPNYNFVPVEKMVEEADVITISIGGNNVLQPMIGAMMMYYELNPEEASVEELLAAITDRGADCWYWVTQQLLEKLKYADPEECPLWQGVFQFQEDWPRIIEAIHDLNPEAHIIVLSIYNPVSKLESPELYQLMEELVHPMNQTMRRHQGRRVSMANVYNVFRRDEGAVGFSVLWRPNLEPYPNLDPHPTTHGHQLIVEELMRVRNPRAFR